MTNPTQNQNQHVEIDWDEAFTQIHNQVDEVKDKITPVVSTALQKSAEASIRAGGKALQTSVTNSVPFGSSLINPSVQSATNKLVEKSQDSVKQAAEKSVQLSANAAHGSVNMSFSSVRKDSEDE